MSGFTARLSTHKRTTTPKSRTSRRLLGGQPCGVGPSSRRGMRSKRWVSAPSLPTELCTGEHVNGQCAKPAHNGCYTLYILVVLPGHRAARWWLKFISSCPISRDLDLPPFALTFSLLNSIVINRSTSRTVTHSGLWWRCWLPKIHLLSTLFRHRCGRICRRSACGVRRPCSSLFMNTT